MKWTAPNAARADNLLVRLYRLARRQQENFTTEALAHVLRHLGAHHAEATSRVLEWLTSGELLVGRPAGAPSRHPHPGLDARPWHSRHQDRR
jgi:hypothetical protein